ncbi:hypothetical protein [Geminocystis sp. NIES-3709]|uniref:hypothetical protein n=1 Tax=Geminocystis sp. NIES-3709 TaxID=1617448 RepID=UPI0005FC9F9C|nr:hypothetical protein [Geminocystis sp. NIES-3709]BAQ65576.1 hypothetical protein GM3709_2341 [Geminocystis sp. NIES-3709]
MKKGQRVTEIKTGKTGVYLRKNPRQLSIELLIVRWDGDNHESMISTTLLKEGQWNYGK